MESKNFALPPIPFANAPARQIPLAKLMEAQPLKAAGRVTAWRERTAGVDRIGSRGEPYVWVTGGALLIALAMILGMLSLILAMGLSTFLPQPILQITTANGEVFLGEVFRKELSAENAKRRLLRTGNFELTGTHFHWISDGVIQQETQPPLALLIERLSWGRFYGFPKGYILEGTRHDGVPVPEIWNFYMRFHSKVLAEVKNDPGLLSRDTERYQLILATADGQEKTLPLTQIVRAFFPNQLGLVDKVSIYLSRWREFLFAAPREANSEGGVFPAIFGTVCMTLLMSIFVLPLGVMAAFFLREYAKDGPLVRITRIAINNLAGVPSIVFGVFGLGFFCYICGASIDQIFFAENLPNPTFGKGALIWAALTLALLTLPVVIVATEEALAAVPNSLRQGSYACGATQWQTIRRIILPRALPGIMTGMILAIARGAGEVAPLMLVGAAKLAPKLPIDGEFPFLHPERSFMHLGYHIYDLAFQSQNSEAALPMVFTTTLLLILIVLSLNLIAMIIRTRLRRAYGLGQF